MIIVVGGPQSDYLAWLLQNDRYTNDPISSSIRCCGMNLVYRIGGGGVRDDASYKWRGEGGIISASGRQRRSRVV